MIRKCGAFSLIELMVVIAIVAILAAVAIPAYNRYLISSRISEAAIVVQSLMEQSIIVGAAGQYGFPTTYESDYPDWQNPMGFGNNGGEYANDAIAAGVIPYFLPSTQNGGLLFGDLSPCGLGIFGVVAASLDTSKLGFNPSVADNNYVSASNAGGTGFNLTCWFYVAQGVMNRFCDYSYGTASGSAIDDILPGWTNANTTTGNDLNNENSQLWNNPAFLAANNC